MSGRLQVSQRDEIGLSTLTSISAQMSGNTLSILLYLLDVYINNNYKPVKVSSKDVVKHLRLSREVARKSIKQLVDNEFISMETKRDAVGRIIGKFIIVNISNIKSFRKDNKVICNKTGRVIKKGYVYLIRDALGHIKIGITSDMKKRKKQYVTENSQPFSILLSVFVNNYVAVEEYLHSLFHKHRLHGEWFNLSDGQIQQAKEYLLTLKPNV